MSYLLNVAFTILVGLLLLPGVGQAGEHAITQAEMVQHTQELFDAVATGDQTPWKKYFADDCMFHDEKGRGLDKTGLIADVTPLPKGYSGSIKVANPQSVINRDCAVLSYDTEEVETIYGQELHARYHGTDTWLFRDGEWHIVAAQTMRYYEDPAVGRSDPTKFSAYVGTYELAKESERKTMITTENGQLFMERTGGKKTRLISESAPLFFRQGVEGRILFHQDPDGKVDTLIDRRNNEDVVWKKVQ